MEVLSFILLAIAIIFILAMIALAIFIIKLFGSGIIALITYVVSNIWTLLIWAFVIFCLFKMCSGS